MRMIDLGSERGAVYIMDTATTVECGREMRFRRSLRSLVECMVPCCGFQPSSSDDDHDSLSTTTTTPPHHDHDHDHHNHTHNHSHAAAAAASSSTVSGTFFGFRKGRVSFCVQRDTRSSPVLLLEFAVPTAYLAREMQHGLLRIALMECDGSSSTRSNTRKVHEQLGPSCSLYNVPLWSMYCNGRKVGYALRRHISLTHLALLKQMQSVSVGAGVLPNSHPHQQDAGDLMYLRANFERVIGSLDSHSFHMINPVGSSAQELSIFLLRS